MTKLKGLLFIIAAMILFSVAAILISCSKSGGGIDVDPDIYPSNITDLRVAAVTPNSVTLEWTAPGEDDTIGTATEYDLRFSMKEITWQNWDSAQQIDGEPTPQPYGTTETMTITGLMEDSTYYFAIMAFNSYDHSSWMSNCVVAVCFDNFVVTFPDPRLNAVVRQTIGIPTGDIHRADLLDVQFIGLNDDSVQDLSGMEYCVNLITLFMSGNRLSDLTPLAGLTKMRALQIANNQITDISPLAGLVNLEQIFLNDNSISDISALAGMSILSDVSLSNNSITDISPIANKLGMTMLGLDNNNISDISALAGMDDLISLNLAGNHVLALNSLAGSTALTYLSLYGNEVSDISPLAAMVNLEQLNLWDNNITDITSLAGLTKLKALYLIANQISDISALSGMTQMQGLFLSFNPISDISSLSGMTALTEFQIQNGNVVDLTPLQNLPNLKKLVLYNNSITDIYPLVLNNGIGDGDTIYLTGNPLDQETSVDIYIPDLQARGVTVYF